MARGCDYYGVTMYENGTMHEMVRGTEHRKVLVMVHEMGRKSTPKVGQQMAND